MTETLKIGDGEAIAGTTKSEARFVGLVGDDHCAYDDGRDLPDEVLTAFDGVDLILHLGHMGSREVLGRGALTAYEKIAPVLGVRDYYVDAQGEAHLTPADGDRIKGVTRVVDFGVARIGLVHNLGRPPGPVIATPPGGLPEPKEIPAPELLAQKFGSPVDVIAYAGSHRPAVVSSQGVLLVNPGSPSYPKGPGRTPGTRAVGTVGLFRLSETAMVYEPVDLSAFQAAGEAV